MAWSGMEQANLKSKEQENLPNNIEIRRQIGLDLSSRGNLILNQSLLKPTIHPNNLYHLILIKKAKLNVKMHTDTFSMPNATIKGRKQPNTEE